MVNKTRGDVNLVGTVHVSKQTRDRVINTIQENEPDVVAIELDSDRLSRMIHKLSDESRTLTEEQTGAIQQLVRSYQQNAISQGDNLLKPGTADMLPATNEAISQNSRVALIDLPSDELLDNIKSDMFTDGSLDLELLDGGLVDIIDNLRDLVSARGDMVMDGASDMEEVVQNFEEASYEEIEQQFSAQKEVVPEVFDNLITKRDKYMSAKINWIRNQGSDVVAVVGKGHVPGVKEYLENPNTIPDRFYEQPDWHTYETVPLQ
jgi:pheromone shutdown protein TraB